MGSARLVWYGGVIALADDQTWTVRATLDWCVGYLERKGDENPRLSAQWLLSEATGLSRIQLYANFDRPLSMEERTVLRDYVTRRGKGEPLQYITGEVGFRYITVKVKPGVLIPRPETEVLVSEALALLPAAERRVAADSLLNEYDGAALYQAQAAGRVPEALEPAQTEQAQAEPAAGAGAAEQPEALNAGEGTAGANARHHQTGGAEAPAAQDAADYEGRLLVADICTGSGCIACSIASERSDVFVVATDISPQATALAQENVNALDLAPRVRVLQGDLGQPLLDAFPQLDGKLDVVVSNPPYVPSAVMEQIPREVADYEPALALDGGEDGLDLFRGLLDFCRHALRPGGGFAFELHETCLDQAADLARRAGFANVRVVYDLTDRPRVLTGLRPQ